MIVVRFTRFFCRWGLHLGKSVLVLLALSSQGDAARAEDMVNLIDQTIEGMRLRIHQIRTVQFDATSITITNEQGLQREIHSTYRLTIDGAKFRHEYTSNVHTPSGKDTSFVCSYDGDKYFSFSPEIAHLIRGSGPILPSATGTVDPFIAIYLFAFSPDDRLGWSALHSDSTWNWVRKRITDCKVEDGLNVLTLSHPKASDWAGELHIDPDRGFLPVRMLSYKAGVQIDETVIDETVSVDGEAIWIPTKIAIRNFNDMPLSAITFTIDPATVQVNESTEGTNFRIPDSKARILSNMDTGEVINLGGMTPQSAREVPMGRTFWAMVVLIGVVLCTAAALYTRRTTPNA